MNKEEILQKSRNEKYDEMAVFTNDKSIKWTYIAMVLSAGIFAFIRGLNGEPILDLCATVSFSAFVGQLYRYIKMKDKGNLIIAAVMLVCCIFASVRFFMGH